VNCPRCGAAVAIDLVAAGANPPTDHQVRGIDRDMDARPPGWGPNRSQNPRQQTQTEGSDLGELLNRIDNNCLSDSERRFVDETRERFARYRGATRMTDKQMSWIRKIVMKYAA